MKHDRGFALVLLLALLPALLSGFAALLLTLGLVQTRSKLRNSCRRTLLGGLESAGRELKTLIDLNTPAQELRTSISVTKAAISAASAAGQVEVAAALEVKLRSLQVQQILLDLRQRSLVVAAQTAITAAQSKALAGVAGDGNSVVTARPRGFSAVRPAVHRVGSGPAPDYALDSSFSDAQKLEQQWQSDFALPGALGKFLNVTGHLEETCAATLQPGDGPWRARLAEDKF